MQLLKNTSNITADGYKLYFIRAPPTNVQTNVGGALLFLACPSVRGCSNLVIFKGISSKFQIWMAVIKLSFKFEYRFCPMKDNQDG